MVQKGSWRGMEHWLLLITYLVLFVLFAWRVGLLPEYSPIGPDEARIVNAIRGLETGWFPASSEVRVFHLLPQVDYYLLGKVTTVTYDALRITSAIFAIAAFAYLGWLAHAYALLGRASLLVLLFLLTTNFSLDQYAGWGVFDYSQRIFISVLLLHALLFLQRKGETLSARVLSFLVLIFCLLTIGNASHALPIAVLVVLAYLCRPRAAEHTARPRRALVNALVQLVPVVAAGLITLAFFTHEEFRMPRREIHWMYFPTSDHPQDAMGLLTFLVDRTRLLLNSTFYPLWPLPPRPSAVSTGIIIAFGVGLIRSLFACARDSARFVTGAYVGLVLVSLMVLSAAGVYAFGDIRYAQFIQGPLLLVAALGIADAGGGLYAAATMVARRLSAPSLAARARLVSVAAVIALSIAASVSLLLLARTVKADMSRRFGTIVQLIEADQSPLVIYDNFAKPSLDALGIDFPDRRTFLIDELFLMGRRDVSQTSLEEYRALLSTGQDVLWISFHPPDLDALYADFVNVLEAGHVKVREERLEHWQVVTWKGGADSGMAARSPGPG